MINLDPAVQKALADFAARDPSEMAAQCGAIWKLSEGCFVLPCLGGQVRVSYPEGVIVPEGADRPIVPGTPEQGQISRPGRISEPGRMPEPARILCLHYLTQARGAALTGRWTAFRELPGGAIYTGPFAKRIVKPLIDIFAGRPEALRRAALALGGKVEAVGDVSVTIPVFPRVPVTYILWLGDEEFGPSGSVLYDESASAYLTTEDLIVAASEGLGRLKSQSEGDDGR